MNADYEKKIQSSIIKWLDANGAFVIKSIISNRSGTPDLIVCYKGIFLAIEVKRPGNQPTELQKRCIRLISQAGGWAFTAYCLEDVKVVIKKLDQEGLPTWKN